MAEAATLADSLHTHCHLAEQIIAPSDYGISVAGGLSLTLSSIEIVACACGGFG